MNAHTKQLEKKFLDYGVINVGLWLCIAMMLHNGTQGQQLFIVMLVLTIGVTVATFMGLFYMLRFIIAVIHDHYDHHHHHHHHWHHP